MQKQADYVEEIFPKYVFHFFYIFPEKSSKSGLENFKYNLGYSFKKGDQRVRILKRDSNIV